MAPIIEPPSLPAWAQQLVGILPLTALIEFVDEAAKLHTLELAGLTPFWSWPISPKGARLLLSTEDTTDACCLDRPGAVPTLHCMDAKFGDHYPSAAAATTRLFLRNKRVDVKIESSFVGLKDRTRQQRLDVYVVEDEPLKSRHGPVRRLINILWGPVSLHYALFSMSGWLLWTGGIVGALLSGMVYGMIYLLLMPISGYLVSRLFGSSPRSLLSAGVGRGRSDKSKRLVVATSSLNGQDWSAFIGPRNSVNALLNRPLQRSLPPLRPNLYRWALRLLILGQWSIIIVTSTLQSWDAVIVTFWTVFCSVSVTCLYSPEHAASDWLEHHCGIRLNRLQAKLGARRSLLAALIYLNPDSESTEWMNPILAKCEERTKWEKALMKYAFSDKMSPEDEKEYWAVFIKEGTQVGKKIVDEIAALQAYSSPRENMCAAA